MCIRTMPCLKALKHIFLTMNHPKKTGAAIPKKAQPEDRKTTAAAPLHKEHATAQDTTLEIREQELTQILEKKILAQVRQVVRHESHSGPIPSGKQLAEYEEVCPGAAQLILDEFKKNGEHMRTMQRDALVAQKSDNDWNRAVAAGLVLCSIAAVVWLAHTNHDVLAGILATTTVGAVITGFLNSRAKQSSKENASPEE